MKNYNQPVGNKNAVIYIRVSTKEQVEEGNSLASQKKICQEYADKHGYKMLHLFEEQGESAKTANRTELQKMLTFCAEKKNAVSTVIIYKLDRLARNAYDYAGIKLSLRKCGVEIKSCTESFGDDSAGKFMENVMAVVAQFDNDVRAERCSGGMLTAVRDGRYVWTAPIGYDNTRIVGQATIAQNKMAPLVREAFELVATGLYPVEDVWRMMLEKGLRKKSGQPIGRSYFHEMIRNELYTGWIEKFGERHKGLFDPIVSEELFNQVQRILKNKGRKSLEYKRDNENFPLRRFIVDPITGKKLTGSFTKGRYPYYRFGMKGSNYKKDAFTSSYKAYMDKHALSEELVDRLKKFVREEFGKQTQGERNELERIEARLKEISNQETLLVQKNLKGVINDEMLAKQLAFLESERSEIDISKCRIKSGSVDVGEAIAFCEEYLATPSQVWERAGVSSKLKLQWFQFPKGITFDGEKFGTPEISLVFKAKEAFQPLHSTMVDPTGFEPVTSSLQMRRSTN